MVNFRDPHSVPAYFLFLVNGSYHQLKPAVDPCHYVILFVVYLQEVDIMRGRDSINHCVFVDKQLQTQWKNELLGVIS